MTLARLIAILLTFLLAAGALTGCNTVRGVGEDVEAAGDAVSDAAQEAEDELEDDD